MYFTLDFIALTTQNLFSLEQNQSNPNGRGALGDKGHEPD